MEKQLNDRFEQIENSLKEQEHRITRIITNLLRYGFDNSNLKRRNAVWKAFLAYFLRQSKITLLIATTSGLIAIVSLFLAWKANNIIEYQNSLLEQQNERIMQQTYLQEAERRSSLNYLVGNILDRIDTELRDSNNKDRKLSPQLIGSIISLSQRLMPYRFLENGKLTSKEYSPERGQLFTALINSELDEKSIQEILHSSDFSHSLIENTRLYNIDLQGLKLDYSRIRSSFFENVGFRGSSIKSAIIENVYFKECDLRYTNFENSKFDSTKLILPLLHGCILPERQFDNSKIQIISPKRLSKYYEFEKNTSPGNYHLRSIEGEYEFYRETDAAVKKIVLSSDLYIDNKVNLYPENFLEIEVLPVYPDKDTSALTVRDLLWEVRIIEYHGGINPQGSYAINTFFDINNKSLFRVSSSSHDLSKKDTTFFKFDNEIYDRYFNLWE